MKQIYNNGLIKQTLSGIEASSIVISQLIIHVNIA